MTEEEKQEEFLVEEAQPQEVVEEKKPSEQEINWQKANEALKLQRQKIEELEQRLSQQQAKPEPEKDEFAELDPEEYLTVAKAKAFAEKLAEKKAKEAARQIVEEYARGNNVQVDETRCRGKYDDYDYVVENYAIPLIKNDPALAYKIQNSKNPAETAYKLGKLSDEYQEESMKQTSPKAEKIIKNTQRPLSANAVTSPNKSKADDFSKMTKQQIWELSEKYSRQA